jgi:YegS/Rv2252/BmrU family lipid kinase
MPLDLVKVPRQGVLVVNDRARKGHVWFEGARNALLARGFELSEARSFRHMDELIACVDAAIEANVPTIAVGGGDGTIGSVAHHFAHRRSVLAVLPMGTGNAFARDLGVPASVEGAVGLVFDGKVATVDLGYVNDKPFLNVATVGLTTLVAQSLSVPLKRRWGRWVYLAAMLRALARVEPFHLEIVSDVGSDAFDTLQVVIGNGRFHAGPFPISPRASLTEGRLSIYALENTSKRTLLRVAMRLPRGKHVDLPEVHHQEARSGELRTNPPMPVTVDGEICMETPVRFYVDPDAIRVVAPLAFGQP